MRDRDGLRLKLAGLAIAGAALSATSAAIALSNPTATDRATIAVCSVMLTAVPVGVGIYAWGREPRNRFGALLVATGFLGPDVVVGIRPRRRLQHREGFALGRRGGAALHDARLPDGSTAKTSGAGCGCGHRPTGNHALHTHDFHQRAVRPAVPADDVHRRLPDQCIHAHRLGARVPRRGRIPARCPGGSPVHHGPLDPGASNQARDATHGPVLVPVLAMAIVRLGAVAVYQLAASNYPDSPFTEVVGWMAGFGIPAMSIAFLGGLIYWRLVEARTLEQVTAGLRPDLGPEGLESLLSDSGLGGSVRVLYRAPAFAGGSDRWAIGAGLIAQLPAPGSSQVVAEYQSGENKVAVVHEEMLHGQTRFLEAIASCGIASYGVRATLHRTGLVPGAGGGLARQDLRGCRRRAPANRARPAQRRAAAAGHAPNQTRADPQRRSSRTPRGRPSSSVAQGLG